MTVPTSPDGGDRRPAPALAGRRSSPFTLALVLLPLAVATGCRSQGRLEPAPAAGTVSTTVVDGTVDLDQSDSPFTEDELDRLETGLDETEALLEEVEDLLDEPVDTGEP